MRRLAILALMLACAMATPAMAATERLDPSFGVGGRVLWPTSLNGVAYSPSGEAAQSPDGHVFALLDANTLLGFAPNGQIAADFGAGGSLELFGPDDLTLGSVGVAVDQLGRVVVATTLVPWEVRQPGGEYQPEPVSEQNHSILVTRFTPAGRPDPSFGENGRVVTKLGLPPPQISPGLDLGVGVPRRARVTSAGVAVDTAGRIVLSGNYLVGYESCSGPVGYRTRRDAFLARLDPAGRSDPSFGANGVVVLREGAIGAPVPDRIGGVFASVRAAMPCEATRRESAGFLFHLDAAGAPVASFGQGGWRTIPEDPNVKLLPDEHGGLILMPGSAQWRRSLILRRLRADGSWDPEFGRGSTAEPFPAPRGTLVFTDAGLGLDGEIYVSGIWKRKARGNGAARRFLLFRLDRLGRLDRGYGILRTGFGKGSAAQSRFLLIAPDGKPLALGPVKSPLLPGGEGLAIARYLAGG